MGLTSHTAAMDLMIQVPGNGVVPRQPFGQIPQLFMGASSEQGAQTVASYRQVPHGLQQVEQHRNWYGVQDNRLQRVHHLDQYTEQNGMNPPQMRVGFYRLFQRT